MKMVQLLDNLAIRIVHKWCHAILDFPSPSSHSSNKGLVLLSQNPLPLPSPRLDLWTITWDMVTTWGQFQQRFTRSFYAHRSQKQKKTEKLSIFFDFLIMEQKKLLLKHWLNCHLGPIFATFYVKLLCTQIPKAKRDRKVVNLFFDFLIFAQKSCL